MIARLRQMGLAFAAMMMTAEAALAQRPPSPGQGPPQMSFERAWAWLLARPGVMIAIAVIVAVIIFMVISNRRSKS